jgi:hypothetical protein
MVNHPARNPQKNAIATHQTSTLIRYPSVRAGTNSWS